MERYDTQNNLIGLSITTLPFKQKSILFNANKKETHHPSSGFKKLFRKLRNNYKVSTLEIISFFQHIITDFYDRFVRLTEIKTRLEEIGYRMLT